MAQKRNIVLDQGSEFSYSFEYSDPISNSVANSLNYTGRSQFRKHYTSLTSYTMNVSLTNTNVTISMSSNNSSNVEPGRYLYDVELVRTSTNSVYRIVEGIITVTPNITRTANN